MTIEMLSLDVAKNETSNCFFADVFVHWISYVMSSGPRYICKFHKGLISFQTI